MSFFSAVLNGEANLSVASLPFTLFLSALPHWYSIYLAESNKVNGGWKNENPRAYVARLNAKYATGKKLSDLEETILRGQSAQQNGFEWWPVWAVAVVVGYLAKVPKSDMNYFTTVHLVSRILYTIAYLKAGSRKSSLLRTLVFQISIYPAVAIFVKAARILN